MPGYGNYPTASPRIHIRGEEEDDLPGPGRGGTHGFILAGAHLSGSWLVTCPVQMHRPELVPKAGGVAGVEQLDVAAGGVAVVAPVESVALIFVSVRTMIILPEMNSAED
jgi:hypothetical protein